MLNTLTTLSCLIARTHDTLSRLLHLLQHLAAHSGLLLNGSKCQLLCIHPSPVSLSLSLSGFVPSSTVIVLIAPLSLLLLRSLLPLTPLSLSSRPSTLAHSSPLPLPLPRTSIFAALKRPLPSSPLTHSLVTLSSPKSEQKQKLRVYTPIVQAILQD